MEQSISQLDFEPETEYRAIETALLETARGRWFLAEHGRRARRVDSAVLQDAIGRLQSSLRDPPALLGQLRNEVVSLQVLLNETRSALVANQGWIHMLVRVFVLQHRRNVDSAFMRKCTSANIRMVFIMRQIGDF